MIYVWLRVKQLSGKLKYKIWLIMEWFNKGTALFDNK